MGEKIGDMGLPFLSLLCSFSHPTTMETKRFFFLYFKKARKAGDGVPLARALSAQQQVKVELLQHPRLWPLKIPGTHTCWGRTPQTVAFRPPQPLHSVLQRQRILGLFRHASESSAKHRKSTVDYQKLILFLPFWAVTFERPPGADSCLLPTSVLPFDCHFPATPTAASFCSWATELAHLTMPQSFSLWHSHPPSLLQTGQVNLNTTSTSCGTAHALAQTLLASMPCAVSVPSHLANALFQRHPTGALSPSHADPTAGTGQRIENVFRWS